MKIDEKYIRYVIRESFEAKAKRKNINVSFLVEKGVASVFGNLFKPLTSFYGGLMKKGASKVDKVWDSALGALEKEMKLSQLGGDGNLDLKKNKEHQAFFIKNVAVDVEEVLEIAIKSLEKAKDVEDWTPTSAAKEDIENWAASSSGQGSEGLFDAFGQMTGVAEHLGEMMPEMQQLANSAESVAAPNEAVKWITDFTDAYRKLGVIVDNTKDELAIEYFKDSLAMIDKVGSAIGEIKSEMEESTKDIKESCARVVIAVKEIINEDRRYINYLNNTLDEETDDLVKELLSIKG